jgi:hypothetical protein
MANPTTNYGFVLPTSTDLVTDLPADFDIALQGVDTRLKALQPGTTLGDIAYSSATANTSTRLPIGTTGQVLAVSGGVPAWTTTADVTPLTTKGDLFTFDTADARLGVGTNGQTLVADSTASTGLKWATPSSGALTLVSTTTFSAVSSQSFNNVFSSTYTNYKVMMNFHTSGGGTTNFRFRAAGTDLTAANYSGLQYVFTASGAGSAGFASSQDSVANLLLNSYNNTSGVPTGIDMTVYDPMSTSARKNYSANVATSNIYYGLSYGMYYGSTGTAFDGFTLVMNAGTMTGTVSVYGMSK